MNNKLTSTLLIILISMCLTACGGYHTSINFQNSLNSSGSNSLAQIESIEINVNDSNAQIFEHYRDVFLQDFERYLNTRCANCNKVQLVDLSDNSNEIDFKIKASIIIDPGIKALRYLVGFGAGKATTMVNIQVYDKNHKTLFYETTTEGWVAMGFFGGSSDKMIRKTLRSSVIDVADKLRGKRAKAQKGK